MKFELFIERFFSSTSVRKKRRVYRGVDVAEIRITGFKEEERERERYFVGRKKILSASALCLRAVISGGMCAIVTLHVIPIHMLYRPGTRNSLQ